LTPIFVFVVADRRTSGLRGRHRGAPDRIERTDILGGLIHEYHAVAA